VRGIPVEKVERVEKEAVAVERESDILLAVTEVKTLDEFLKALEDAVRQKN